MEKIVGLRLEELSRNRTGLGSEAESRSHSSFLDHVPSGARESLCFFDFSLCWEGPENEFSSCCVFAFG